MHVSAHVNIFFLHNLLRRHPYHHLKPTFTMEFCTNCQTIINNLFIRSRYQSAVSSSYSQLVQRFSLGSDYRAVYSINEECNLCAFIKLGLPSEDVARRVSETWPADSRSVSIQTKGGNAFRHASNVSGLQLFQMKVAMTVQLEHSQSFNLELSMTAAKGTKVSMSWFRQI